MEEKKSGMNSVWDRTAALIGISRTTAQKIVEEKKKSQDEQQQPKQPTSSTSKVSLGDFDQGVVRRTFASMYILKVLPTLDNIRTELKQSIGYTRINGRLKRAPLYEVCLHTLLVNRKVLMERQDVVPSQIRYLRRVRELREAGYTVVYRDETYVHTSQVGKKVLLDLRIVELH